MRWIGQAEIALEMAVDRALNRILDRAIEAYTKTGSMATAGDLPL